VYGQVYVEDSLGDRTWVDNEHCCEFVDNILTAFATKIPPSIRQLTESMPTTPMTAPVSMTTEGMKGELIKYTLLYK
jgi:integrator complex subunit 1